MLEDLKAGEVEYELAGVFLAEIKKEFGGEDEELLKVACYMQVYLSRNNVPTVKPPPNHTSLPSMVATSLATCLMAVLQPSGYSIFHGGDTPIQLSLP